MESLTTPTQPGARRGGDNGRRGEGRGLTPGAVLALVLLVLAISAGLRLWHLSSPGDPYMFDEVYYAKDAKAILDGRMDPRRDNPWWPGDVKSWGHPDAGKLAIAAGIAVFGDRPLGWRLPAVVAGLALLAGVYPVARRLGLSRGWALVALTLAAADLLGIAQSRIAMLDIFVAAWTLFCILCALRYVQMGERTVWLLLCGLCGGAATASKWSGLLALVAALCLILLGSRVRALAPPVELDEDAHRPDQATGERGRSTVRGVVGKIALVTVSLTALPALVYLASYTPYLLDGHTFAQLRELHAQMWHWNLTVRAPHSYASRAPTWIFDYRPVWYAFTNDGKSSGVVAMGNPFLWWSGVAALVAAPLLAIWRRKTLPLLPAVLVAILYFPWFGASRTSFLFYMTPVAPFIAILVAATAATLVGPVRAKEEDDDLAIDGDSGRLSDGAALGLAVVAAAVTALLWDAIGRWVEAAYWRLPWHVSPPSKWWVVLVPSLALLAFIAACLAGRRSRAALTAVLLGCVVGIAVPFLPIVLDIGISWERLSRLLWFRRWI
jgi:dolichyl-phosphate-mannose--protein O-mannosyl transferase